jgi:integrase
MPRKRTGTKEFKAGRWHIKLTVNLRGGGTDRRRITLAAGTTEPEAEKKRISLAKKAEGRLFEPEEEIDGGTGQVVFKTYVEDWLKARIARGLRSVRKDRQHLTDHVMPNLGSRLMRDVTSDHIHEVVRTLDRKIHDPDVRFAWKTASKTWGAVTKLFRDAAHSKNPDLRILKFNPCTGVEGPDRGIEKVAQWLYPSEFVALVTCEDLPLRWRRIYALTAYLDLRLSEIRALCWEDLDLVHGMVRVHRSTDERGKVVREHTKSGTVRHFRIEPGLRPLLNQMVLEGDGQGEVFSGVEDAAGELRRHLLRAGVTRQALHVGTASSLALRFHDLRASGITWAALRGDSTIEIRDRAGHTDVEQTNDYIRRAAGCGDVGEPFPDLGPLFHIVPGIVPSDGHKRRNGSKAAVSVVRRGGLEPP